MWLCFCFCLQPTLLIVHRDLKESDTETFSGDIWIFFPAFETEEKGNTKRKAADRMPNATNLFWSKENLGEFPHILGWMVVMLELFSQFFLLIYFWHLTGGTKSVLHSSISVLKSCLLFAVLASWMSASILFRSCLAHLNCRSFGVLSFSLSLSLFQRDANLTVD